MRLWWRQVMVDLQMVYISDGCCSTKRRPSRSAIRIGSDHCERAESKHTINKSVAMIYAWSRIVRPDINGFILTLATRKACIIMAKGFSSWSKYSKASESLALPENVCRSRTTTVTRWPVQIEIWYMTTETRYLVRTTHQRHYTSLLTWCTNRVYLIFILHK